MKIQQVVVTGQNEVELQHSEISDNNLGWNEVLIETEWTVISAGTELANYTALEPSVFQPGAWCAYPWRSGYANVGIVRGVGEGVARVAVGDRVFSYGPHASAFRYDQTRLLIRVPDAIPPDIAALSRMAGVAATASIVSDIHPDAWVAIFGLGMVGNLAGQIYSILGCRVIGVDPVAERCDLAKRCDFDAVIATDAANAHAQVTEITGNQGAAITVDAVGDSGVIREAVAMTARLGQHVLLGTPRAPVEGNLTDAFKPVHLRNITLRGALEWCIPMYPASDGGVSQYNKQEMIFDWIIRSKLHVDVLISHRLAPNQIKQAYEGLLRQKDVYTAVAIRW